MFALVAVLSRPARARWFRWVVTPCRRFGTGERLSRAAHFGRDHAAGVR